MTRHLHGIQLWHWGTFQKLSTNLSQFFVSFLPYCTTQLALRRGVHDAAVHWKGSTSEKWNGPVADAADSQQEEVSGRGKFSRRRPKHQEKKDKKDLQNNHLTTQMAVPGSTCTQGTMAWIDMVAFQGTRSAHRNHFSVTQSPSTEHCLHLCLNWSDPTRTAIVEKLMATQDVQVCGGEAG